MIDHVLTDRVIVQNLLTLAVSLSKPPTDDKKGVVSAFVRKLAEQINAGQKHPAGRIVKLPETVLLPVCNRVDFLWRFPLRNKPQRLPDKLRVPLAFSVEAHHGFNSVG